MYIQCKSILYSNAAVLLAQAKSQPAEMTIDCQIMNPHCHPRYRRAS